MTYVEWQGLYGRDFRRNGALKISERRD